MNKQIIINPKIRLIDTSYKGIIKDDDIEYPFWLVHSQDFIEETVQGSYTVEWFFKKVPMKIRTMEVEIIKQFKQSLKVIE